MRVHTPPNASHRTGWAVGLAALGWTSLALAWSQNAEFTAKVHGHAFERVIVASEGCKIHYQLYFDAPNDAYASLNGLRNVYRFRTRVDFQSGRSATVPVFANRGTGRRVYRNTFDSGAEGCWANGEQKLAGVKVEACRGDGCTPDPIR